VIRSIGWVVSPHNAGRKWGNFGLMANLDQIDRRLLAELQDEGRVTNVELAQRVGLTAPHVCAVSVRWKKKA
jgi:hypothetical protein